MQKLFKIPLLFFLIAACMGLLLRYQLIAPLKGLNYTYLLHGHSHVMFLGWMFNVLFLGFVLEFAPAYNRFKGLFWVLQVCVAVMLVSFPLQGYGVLSIIVSTVHTATSVGFIALFFKTTKQQQSLALTLAKISLLFFALSAIGPFGLAYLKSTHLQHTDAYRFALYFYLHFQYNGFFFFGALSLFTKIIETSLSLKSLQQLRSASYMLAIACIPAYVLSVLWAKPGLTFTLMGLLAALIQVVGVGILVKPIRAFFAQHHHKFNPQTKFLFSLAFIALIIKVVLQLISVHPTIAAWSNDFRSITIAYLHLMLVGVLTFFLIGWMIHKRVILPATWSTGLLLLGFVGSEITLIVLPWWHEIVVNVPIQVYNHLLFFFSACMVAGVALLLKAGLVSSR